MADMEVDMVVNRVAEKSGPNRPLDFYVIKIALSVVSEVPPWALDVFHRYKQRFGNFFSCINFALNHLVWVSIMICPAMLFVCDVVCLSGQ